MSEEKNKEWKEDKKNKTTEEMKQEVLDEIRWTLKSSSLLVKTIFKPVVNFIEKKYENLSEEQRNHIQKMINDIKSESKKWIWDLKQTVNKFFNKEKWEKENDTWKNETTK